MASYPTWGQDHGAEFLEILAALFIDAAHLGNIVATATSQLTLIVELNVFENEKVEIIQGFLMVITVGYSKVIPKESDYSFYRWFTHLKVVASGSSLQFLSSEKAETQQFPVRNAIPTMEYDHLQ